MMRLLRLMILGLLAGAVLCSMAFAASTAPQWMHNAASAASSLPAYDEKTEAILLYSEISVNVLSADKVRTHVREAYKILRPNGRRYGTFSVSYNSTLKKVSNIKAWCIPADGRDFEVNEKSAIEVAVPDVEGSELISDARAKLLRIPAPEVGNIVGYEYDTEERALFLQEEWSFQEAVPVREAHFQLTLPAGWEYHAAWIHRPEVAPRQSNGTQAEWVVNDVPALRPEEQMPPWHGLSQALLVTFHPSNAAPVNAFTTWKGMGVWYSGLVSPMRIASPEIKEKTSALTVGASAPMDKAQAIARFVQQSIRYVAIEIGIGGVLPHPASDTFKHRYGDCKDKVTLLSTMLAEAGIESYYFVVNTERGSVGPETPAHNAFDHVILAIKLPAGENPSLYPAGYKHPKYGGLLFFDPTDRWTPFGSLNGYLQANYGLLVGPDGGELMPLPQLPTMASTRERIGQFTLSETGRLSGAVDETRTGDFAWRSRGHLHSLNNDADRIKPIEVLLADSVSNFRITKASMINRDDMDQPFGWKYSFDSTEYAKRAGGLMLFRPRVIGAWGSGVLETKEPRKFPFEFDGPERMTDNFEFTLPPGYVVDELPQAVDLEYSFATYHARSELKDNKVIYHRTLELKELSVPVAKISELKRFYRAIVSDERNTVVLRPQ